MLALDIETMGLLKHSPLPPITCACLFDGTVETRLLFICISEEQRAANAATLLRLLDEADVLAGFNAPCFDLVYIQKAFGASEEQLQAWVAKCIDPYMCLKFLLRAPCRLNTLLGRNSLGSKTGSGANAIVLAREGRTQELLDYCAMDAILTWRVCALPSIRVTARHTMSLAQDGHWVIEAEPLPAPPSGPALPAIDLNQVYSECEFAQ